MEKTRLSLYYLATYLTLGGVGFLVAPQPILRLFLATGSYSDVMVRLVGALMLGLGLMVVEIIRHRISKLYRATLVVRTLVLGVLVFLYFSSGDPLLITLLVIVGVGFLLTLGSYLTDQARAAREAGQEGA